MVKSVVIAGVILLSMTITGCDKIIDDKVNEKIGQKMVEYDSKIASIEKKINILDLTNYLYSEELKLLEQKDATVSSENNGYDIAKTKHGIFIIYIEKVEPYLDGVKIKLYVGNSTNIHFNGADVKITWGRDHKDGEDYNEWQSTQKEKVIHETAAFPPGAYTAVNIVLTPAKSEEIKKLKVGLVFNNLSLRRPPAYN